MVSDSTIRLIQNALDGLRRQLASESAKIGPAHAKAAKARQDAAKTRSEATRKSKLAEADREDKKASDAETNRAKLEGKIATKEKEMAAARRTYDEALAREQKQSFTRLQSSIAAREAQSRQTPAAFVTPSTVQVGRETPVEYDVFVSHASEDKADIARPLVQALEQRGLRVWFDELSIQWGQSIHREIENGIARSRFGLVIISTAFMAKEWTNAELDALYGRKMSDPAARILPLWHNVSLDEVQARLPMIASLKAFKTADWSIGEIADEVVKAVRGDQG